MNYTMDVKNEKCQELLSHYILLSCIAWLLKSKTSLRNQNKIE